MLRLRVSFHVFEYGRAVGLEKGGIVAKAAAMAFFGTERSGDGVLKFLGVNGLRVRGSWLEIRTTGRGLRTTVTSLRIDTSRSCGVKSMA